MWCTDTSYKRVTQLQKSQERTLPSTKRKNPWREAWYEPSASHVVVHEPRASEMIYTLYVSLQREPACDSDREHDPTTRFKTNDLQICLLIHHKAFLCFNIGCCLQHFPKRNRNTHPIRNISDKRGDQSTAHQSCQCRKSYKSKTWIQARN